MWLLPLLMKPMTSPAQVRKRRGDGVRQYGLTVRPAGGVEVAGSPTVFVG